MNRWLCGMGSVVVAASLAAVPPSQLVAAEGDVLFEDDYSSLDSAFTSTKEVGVSVKDNILTVSLEKGWCTSKLYQSAIFNDVDERVRTRLAIPDAEKGVVTGLAFWARDYDHYYTFTISDSGTIAAYHWNGQKWLAPMPWRQCESLKTGDGEWNELRVVTAGTKATLYVNEVLVGTLKGRPPEGGSLVGIRGESATDAPGTVEFSAFQVLEPPAAAAPETPEDPNLLIADDFTTLDPAWGAESSAVQLSDGKLVLKSKPKMRLDLLNQGIMIDGDFTATVNVRPTVPNEKETPTAGLMLWASGYDDYYVVTLSPNGLLDGARWTKKRWLTPLAAREIPDAKFDPLKLNELRIATKGSTAAISVNGVEVAVLKGQLPKGGHMVGLYVDGGAGEFDDLKVVRVAAEPSKQTSGRARVGDLPKFAAGRSLTGTGGGVARAPAEAAGAAAPRSSDAATRQRAPSPRAGGAREQGPPPGRRGVGPN